MKESYRASSHMVVTPQEFADRMREIAQEEDIADRHIEADNFMCMVLRTLGYEEGVNVFIEMETWYA